MRRCIFSVGLRYEGLTWMNGGLFHLTVNLVLGVELDLLARVMQWLGV